MTPNPRLSVIVLGYRAGKTLIPLIATLEKLLAQEKTSFEIILVANDWPNTKDPTSTVARQLARRHHHLTTIARKKRGGMGWDLRTGLQRARGDILIYLDGDAQNPLRDVVRVFRLLERKHLDLVKTTRIRRHDGLIRTLQSAIYNLLFRLLFQTDPLHDINAKPKAMTRSLYTKMHLTADDWFIDAEIILKAKHLNAQIGEVETVFYRNDARASFVTFTTAFEFLKNMIIYRWRGLPW